MQSQTPYFNSGRILKKEMLENLRDYPRNYVDILFTDRTDGILYGLTPIMLEDKLHIKKGMLKYKHTTYIIPENTPLETDNNEEEKAIIIEFTNTETNLDFNTTQFNIKIINQSEQKEDNHFILGTFKLKKGAILRTEYKELEDFTTIVNTVNIVDVTYSGTEHQTISPQILKYYAQEILKIKTTDPFDISFCTSCLQSEYIEYQLIQHYLSYKNNIEVKEYTNREIHKELVYILKEQTKNNKVNNENPSNRRKMTIVD